MCRWDYDTFDLVEVMCLESLHRRGVNLLCTPASYTLECAPLGAEYDGAKPGLQHSLAISGC